MKNFYKYFGIVAIMLFSFYYTEKIALFMRQKDPIYETISDVKENQDTTSVNAIIEDDYITPGINGLSINVSKSFQKMKSFGAFNKYYLIFDQVKPNVSLENNKDKIITKGNKLKKAVSLILTTTDTDISQYCQENKIKTSVLINQDTFKRDSVHEQINDDTKQYNETERLLNSINQNKNICLVNNYNEELCKKNKKYLVKPTLELNRSNIAVIKSKIESGTILTIQQNASLEDFKILLNQIKYQGLEIQTLSELISETNEKD